MSTPTRPAELPRLIAYPLGGGGPDRAMLVDFEFADGCERSAVITSHGVETGRRVSSVLASLWTAGSIAPDEIDGLKLLLSADGHACEAWIARELRYMAVQLTDDGHRDFRISLRSAERISLFDLRRGSGKLEQQLCSRDADCDGEEHRWLLLRADCLASPLIWHIDLERGAVVPPTPLVIDPR